MDPPAQGLWFEETGVCVCVCALGVCRQPSSRNPPPPPPPPRLLCLPPSWNATVIARSARGQRRTRTVSRNTVGNCGYVVIFHSPALASSVARLNPPHCPRFPNQETKHSIACTYTRTGQERKQNIGGATAVRRAALQTPPPRRVASEDAALLGRGKDKRRSARGSTFGTNTTGGVRMSVQSRR